MIITEINGKKFEINGKDLFSPVEETTLEDWLLDMRAQDAAQKRHRSLDTVNTHRKKIREKSDAHSVGGVLSFCLSKDYIRILMLAGLISGAELVAHSSVQPATTVRTTVRLARRVRTEYPSVSGGLNS